MHIQDLKLNNIMALKLTKTIKDVTINDCYIKVSSISGNKKEIQAIVSFSANNNADPFELKTFIFDLDINGENPIKQAYLHLKTLPEFADAVDC